MLQYKQNPSKLPVDIQPVLRTENEDSSGQSDTLKIISCPVCRAVYISSLQHQASTPGSLAVLESAFLSLCRTCFHCQRRACPQCWNPIHHMCAACCEEALLPFRSPVPSLTGVIFSSQPEPASTVSFTCLHNGRFYTPEQRPQHTPPVQIVEREVAFSSPAISSQPPTAQPWQDAPASPLSAPSWFQEIASKPMTVPTHELSSHSSDQWEYAPPMTPSAKQARGISTQEVQTQPRSTVMLTQPAQTEQSQMARTLLHLSSLPTQRTDMRAYEQSLLDDLLDEEDEEISLFERIENVLIIVISVLLLAIVLMVILAISSPTMNALFYRFLHIDIRSEILYLLQVR